MTQYRRLRVRGGTYFITISLAEQGTSLLVDHVDLLREAYLATQITAPFTTDAIVILPDHLHAVWTFSPGNKDYAKRIRKFKTQFAHRLERSEGLSRPALWEVEDPVQKIESQDDFETRLAFCWSDPVRHGFTRRAIDWSYSSFRRDVQMGLVRAEWKMPISCTAQVVG